MAGVNKVILVGRLGYDPEPRTTPTGKQTATLRLATSETWMKDGQKQEKTEWHWVILWEKQAELAVKYLKKGSNVFIEGKLATRSWEDKAGGKRYATEVLAHTIQFLDSQRDSQKFSEPPETAQLDEDVPF